ncbi:MAG TPA: hypothetical protein VFA93_02905 [Patescibacteria group bacterium]|nr:hypothetical protein [Patescibacteria group bacterium]
MNLLNPKSSKDYPKAILLYFIIFTVVFFLISSWDVITNLSPDGLYVQRYPCLQTSYDDTGHVTCAVFDKEHPYNYYPAGSLLKSDAISDIIFAGVIVFPVGWYLRRKKIIEEINENEP